MLTLGPAVGEVARRLAKPLMPWQQEVVDLALEYDPATGKYRFREVVLTVPRQSGKTTLILAKDVHRLVVVARQLGPQRVTYMAQTRQKARGKLEKDFADILRAARPFPQIRNPKARPSKSTEWRLSLNNGSENILFGQGNYFQIDVPSRDGGHGDTLDIANIDEAFSQEDDTVEGGVRPTMLTRFNAQLWVLSTAGDARSRYLYRKLLAGRAACESGDHGNVCFVEYSAGDDDDPGDPATWWRTMPALGYTIPLDVVQGEWDAARREGQIAIDKFRRTMLNQWPEVPVLDETAASALPIDVWLKMADPDAPRGQGPAFGADIDTSRMAHIAVAWRRADGDVQVMLTNTGLSPLNTGPRLAELARTWKAPVVLGGPAADLEGEVPGSIVMNGTEFAAATGRFDDLFRDGSLKHGNQPELNEAVRLARWKAYGSAGARMLELRDQPTAGPLAAVIRAIHGIYNQPARPPAAPMAEKVTSSPSEPSIASMQF